MASHGRTPEPVDLSGSEDDVGDATLRAALSLAAIAQQPFVMTWPSEMPGLSRDGVAAAEVARVVFGGTPDGATPGSHRLAYTPASLKSGHFKVDVSGIGVAALLEMAVLPLSLTGGACQVRLSGVTHAHGKPSFHDAAFGWLPMVERLGVAAELALAGAGFEPDGGGAVDAQIFPAPRLRGLELSSRGLLVETQALALVANLGIGIALPLERRLSERLRACGIAAQVEVLPMPADRARGLAAVIVAQFERVRVAMVVTGQVGHPVEEVADGAVQALQRLLSRRGAIPGATAEALLVPLAVAASPHAAPGVIGKDLPTPSHVSTAEITGGLLKIADVVRRMLPVEIQIQGLPGDEGLITVRPRPETATE